MPVFRFIVEDSHGTQRRGQISQSSEAEARIQLEGRGFKVCSLQLDSRGAKLRYHRSTSSPSRDRLSQRLKKKRPPKPKRRKLRLGPEGVKLLILGLVGAGILSFVPHWTSPPRPEQQFKPKVESLSLDAEGRILGYDRGMRVLLRFPEIPLSVTLKEIQANGAFRWEQKIMTQTKPTKVILEILRPSDQSLLEKSFIIPRNGRLDMGTLRPEKG